MINFFVIMVIYPGLLDESRWALSGINKKFYKVEYFKFL